MAKDSDGKKGYVLSIKLENALFRKIQREARQEGLSAAAAIRRTLMRVHGKSLSREREIVPEEFVHHGSVLYDIRPVPDGAPLASARWN